MTEILEMYKCEICGNLVEVVFSGEGELVCCGEPMKKLKENTKLKEMAGEKHVPIVEKTDEGVTIKVGATPHPMENEHYIMFIEANSADKRYVKRKYLYPNEEPVLNLKCSCDKVIARELCYIHGLWTTEDAHSAD